MVGLSKTITNLALSSNNAISSISVSGWPELMDLEMWHCMSMVTAVVTNLVRIGWDLQGY